MEDTCDRIATQVKRIAVANAKLNKMKEREMREFIVRVLISEYRNDPDFLRQDAEIYLKEDESKALADDDPEWVGFSNFINNN